MTQVTFLRRGYPVEIYRQLCLLSCSLDLKVQYRREIWATPDDDVIAVDWCETNKLSSDSPVMVHFHGWRALLKVIMQRH